MRRTISVLCLVVSLLHNLSGQSNYVTWHAFDGGFVQSRSNSNLVRAGAGQPVVGFAQQQGHQVENGFFADTLLRGGVLAYGGPIYTFRRSYGFESTDDFGHSVQQTSDSGYIVAATSYRKAYFVKTNARGDTLWTRIVGGAGVEGAYGIQQTSDGGYIAAGYTTSSGAGGYDVYLVKLNAAGNTVWSKAIGTPNDDIGYAVQQTTDGGYIISGATYYQAGYASSYLVKTNANGDSLWTRAFKSLGADRAALSVRQTGDRGYVFAGYLHAPDVRYVELIKTDSLGIATWTRFIGRVGFQAMGRSVRQTIDGGYVVAGSNRLGSSATSFIQLIKTDQNGDSVWTKEYAGASPFEAYSVQQTSDGGYIMTGETNTPGNLSSDVFLMKASMSGDSLWMKTFGGQGTDERGADVLQTFDGGYVIAGETNVSGPAHTQDVYLIKSDDAGFVTSVHESARPALAMEFKLYQNYPNPFNPATTIGYEISSNAHVDVKIYDILGREVVTLVDGFQNPGTYQVTFDASHVASGVYFYRIIASSHQTMFTSVRKMVVLK